MAFPVEEGLKPRAALRLSSSPAVFMAFPVEEGLKRVVRFRSSYIQRVFMAFPVEEGLKPNNLISSAEGRYSFYGLSSRRRIETVHSI